MQKPTDEAVSVERTEDVPPLSEEDRAKELAQLEAMLERLGPVERIEIAREIIEESVTGPLPPPSMLAEYERICPGIADRIMKLSENEQAIRGEHIKKAGSNDTWRVIGSVVVSLGLIGGAAYCAAIGEPYVGAVLAGSGVITGIVQYFMRAK